MRTATGAVAAPAVPRKGKRAAMTAAMARARFMSTVLPLVDGEFLDALAGLLDHVEATIRCDVHPMGVEHLPEPTAAATEGGHEGAGLGPDLDLVGVDV